MRRLGRSRPPEYRHYLNVQLRRTLGKRANDPGIGLRVLIGEALFRARPAAGASVLCVGCRNGVELDEFRARGLAHVVGIDLFSQRHDIRIMDMHALEFEDSSFDVIFASHSLEHSYDLHRVVREIERVARDGAVVAVEVPVRGSASEADRIVFAGVDELRELFRPYVREELWADEQQERTVTNGQGTEVARLVFRLRKAPSAQPAPVPALRRTSPIPRVGIPARIAVPVGVPALLFAAWLVKAVALRDYDVI